VYLLLLLTQCIRGGAYAAEVLCPTQGMAHPVLLYIGLRLRVTFDAVQAPRVDGAACLSVWVCA